jgi:hypothetical protein
MAPAPPARTPDRSRPAVIGPTGLRLALRFEFLWAFLAGLGYSTPAKNAWIHRGSPTKGFLSGANVGAFQDIFRYLATVPAMDWLFMMGARYQEQSMTAAGHHGR